MSAAPAMLINGVAGSQVAALDRGLQYGDGLFETARWEQGRLRWFDRHLARLGAGCARLGIAMPDAALLRSEAAAIVRAAMKRRRASSVPMTGRPHRAQSFGSDFRP